MAWFGTSSPGAPAAAAGASVNAQSRAESEQIMQRVSAEINQQTSQDLFQRVADKCFAKCVVSPSSKLSTQEQACLTKCQDRYMEAMGVIAKAISNRSKSSSSSDS